MIKLERTSIMNIENAIRGARNPMNSHHKSDSKYLTCEHEIKCEQCPYGKVNKHQCCIPFAGVETYILGENDLDLGQRLCKAGSDHRKFLRQIFVSVDITAPLYFWKEYDTYKVGTTANSTSTMHKIHAKPFDVNDFSVEKTLIMGLPCFTETLKTLNVLRDLFNETKDKDYWYSMIQLLPSSYNQKRTCTLTYENLRNMYAARKVHKLDEWREFCKWVKTLPYATELITGSISNE